MNYSFVLIAYNEADNIGQCINSILAQQQLGDSYEIIVVDDGSKDQTPQIVQELAKFNKRLRLVGDGHNHGRGFGRHLGVNEASGDYVIMVDADIILPSNWLVTALPYLGQFDVAGGIAVPDGDVAYVYRRFELKPKTVMGSTTITGNNGIYKRAVFSKVNFDPNLREGEDVDFNHRSQAAGFKSVCIPGLTVEHQEHKSLARSMQWLYQSGVGATRQLFRFREIRMPDLAFAVTLLALIGALIVGITHGWWVALVLPLLGILGVSLLHLRGKFYLSPKWPLRSLGAWATDSLLILCYYVGRAMGFVVFVEQLVLKRKSR